MKRNSRIEAPRPAAARDLDRFTSVPRDVRLTSNGRFVMGLALLFAAGGVALATILPIVRASQLAERETMIAGAVRASATVVRVTETKGENPRLVVTYRYAGGDAEYEGTARLPRDKRREIAAGSRLAIDYLRSDPSRSWLPGRVPGVLPLALVPLIPFAALAVAGLLAGVVRRERILLSEGRFAQARVTSTVKVQHSNQHRTSFEFRTLNGATVTAATDRSRPIGAPGETFPVVYHRDNPRRNAVYPLSLVALDRR